MERPKILIGVLNRCNPGAISTITRAIIDGLSSSYRFIPHTADRSAASTRLSAFNLLNLLYLLRDYLLWVGRLVRYRPDIAHYPVTSYWNLEKSLLFLKTARLLGARSIGHLHGGAFIEFWKGIGSSRKSRSLKQLRRLDAFVVLSEGWRNMVREEVGIEEEHLHVVYNPLDPEFEQEALAMPIDRSGGTILSIGGMGKLKGLFDIVEAARLCGTRTGFRFVLAGPEREPHAVADARERIEEDQLTDFMELGGGVWG
ncbi:MAG: glycosyltransferase, partial [Bacteroidota bacterium]